MIIPLISNVIGPANNCVNRASYNTTSRVNANFTWIPPSSLRLSSRLPIFFEILLYLSLIIIRLKVNLPLVWILITGIVVSLIAIFLRIICLIIGGHNSRLHLSMLCLESSNSKFIKVAFWHFYAFIVNCCYLFNRILLVIISFTQTLWIITKDIEDAEPYWTLIVTSNFVHNLIIVCRINTLAAAWLDHVVNL